MKRELTLYDIIYMIFYIIIILMMVIGVFKIVTQINMSRMFKPDFEFQYWKKYDNPSCKFNSDNKNYQIMCEELIEVIKK